MFYLNLVLPQTLILVVTTNMSDKSSLLIKLEVWAAYRFVCVLKSETKDVSKKPRVRERAKGSFFGRSMSFSLFGVLFGEWP